MKRLHNLSATLETSTTEQNYQKMKYILNAGMFAIEPTFKKITKAHLAILSTPGVAQVCHTLQADPTLLNKMTIRGKSVAIVSRGGLLNVSGRQFLPVMDWLVAQIKFHANIDCYPFVIRPQCSLADVLTDLSNSYQGVLFLDNEDIPQIHSIPNFFTLSHWKISQLLASNPIDAETSAYILAHLIKNQSSGNVQQEDIIKLISMGPCHLQPLKLNYEHFDEKAMADACSIKLHEMLGGKIGISLKFCNIKKLQNYFTLENFKRLFSEGEAQPCVTSRLNVILTDGTSVLGLGNIGPIPGLPVMQVKSMLFKLLGDANVVPVCINRRKTPELAVEAILDLIHLYKAVNLQDFKAPECFTIQRSLHQLKILSVFHDDQHGTSIAAMAGLINALRLSDRNQKECKVVIAGAGAAGLNIAKIIYNYGITDVIVCDTLGIIYKGREKNMNQFKEQIAEVTNTQMMKGCLEDAIKGADVFIGVSTKDTFKKQWIKSMNPKPIIFALANPFPQISQEDALEGGCYIYASGKNNRPNQISNSLAYPGVFRAINEHNIKKITPEMEVVVAREIAMIQGYYATRWEILPCCLNRNISYRIAASLAKYKEQ